MRYGLQCVLCRSVLAQIGRQVSVFTLGYGSEHDGDCLHGLAAAGNGLFYFVENEDSIPESFCDCLGGLLSVAAQVRLHHVLGGAQCYHVCAGPPVLPRT